MKKLIPALLVALSSLTFFAANAAAHCEIPCGIYDDGLRMNLILEHATTIEKSMKQISELEKGGNSNQLIRWVNNKEKHAEEIQHIVSQYFMTQRIKPDTPDVDKKLRALHKLLIYSMKCKQTTDLDNVEKLRAAADEFHKLYFAH